VAVTVDPKLITASFVRMVGKLEIRLADQDPERSRLGLAEAIGERIVVKPDPSGRFLWAECGLEGERLLASLEVQKNRVVGACNVNFLRRLNLSRDGSATASKAQRKRRGIAPE